MDRLELRAKFASRIEKYRLDEFDMEVNLRPLSALERARVVDKYRAFDKEKEIDNLLEKMTVENQCYVVCRGLVDENGSRLYKDDEVQNIAEEIPSKALDEISRRILDISGMGSKAEDPVKNSLPTTNEDSSSDLQHGSDGGM